MSERAYTVKELQALRRAVEDKWLFGSYNPDCSRPGGRISRSYMETEKIQAVEQLVRTHMLAGHTAADLYDSERQK